MLLEQVEKLNRQNTEHSQEKSDADGLRQDDRARQETAGLILDRCDASAAQTEERKKVTGKEEGEEEDGNIFEDSESEEEKQDEKLDEGKRKHTEKAEASNSVTPSKVPADVCLLPQQRYL